MASLNRHQQEIINNLEKNREIYYDPNGSDIQALLRMGRIKIVKGVVMLPHENQ